MRYEVIMLRLGVYLEEDIVSFGNLFFIWSYFVWLCFKVRELVKYIKVWGRVFRLRGLRGYRF